MRRFLLRLGQSFLLLTALSFGSFALVNLAPGDYFDQMRVSPQTSAETAAALRSQFDLDRPFLYRYIQWLRSVSRGEFGYSFAYATPVGPLLWSRIKNTLLLTTTALLIAWVIALPAGALWAVLGRRWVRQVWSLGSATFLVLPEVVVALSLLLVAVETGVFPVGGMRSLDASELGVLGSAADLIWHMALPVTALVVAQLGVLLRHVRSTVSSALGQPCVRAAHAAGLSPGRVGARHVLPLAANPLISLFGLSIGWLLSGSLVVEAVMSWPGLGPLMLEAIHSRDVHVVIGATMSAATLLVLGNLVADLSLMAQDPRISH